MSEFKYFTMTELNVHADVYFSKQLSKSHENEHEGLLLDCRVAVKVSEGDLS